MAKFVLKQVLNMIKEKLIDQTLKSLAQLPSEKIASVLEFTDFLVKKNTRRRF